MLPLIHVFEWQMVWLFKEITGDGAITVTEGVADLHLSFTATVFIILPQSLM